MSTRRTLPAAMAAAALIALATVGPAHATKPAAPSDTVDSAPASTEARPDPGKSAAAPGQAKKAPATSTSAGSSGPTDQPQPPSTADDNGSGANQSGPYDSTRDGTASANGSGGGTAKGRPCAGCVGKADDKNPKGQLPGPHDRNKGYECDGNKGIAKGNPAHTTCRPGGGTENPPPPGACKAGNPFDDPATDVVECRVDVLPPVVEVPDPFVLVSPPEAAGAPADAVLPQTGLPAELPWVLGFGLVLVAAGGVLTGRSRVRA